MKKSVNQLRVELQEIAVAHDQIHSFFWGDLLRAVTESEVNYPLMQCLYPTATLLNNQTQLELNISIFDKIYKDWTVNLNEVESDTLQICRDIFNIINSSTRWQKIGRVDGCTVQKFIAATEDEVVGHTMKIQFTVRDNSGVCDLPMTDYDYDQSTANAGCEGVTYEILDVDGTVLYSGTVASGGTLSQAIANSIATLKDSGGGVLSNTSILAEGSADITAPDGTYEIYNSAGTLIESGTVASGGTATEIITDSTAVVKNTAGATLVTELIPAEVSEIITVGDLDITINGAAFASTPAEVDVNIVVKDTGGAQVGSKVGTEWIVPESTSDIFIYFSFETGHDTVAMTVDADSAGVYTATTNDGGSGTITFSLNGAPYAAFSNPLTLVNGDTLEVLRTITTNSGWVKITGTY